MFTPSNILDWNNNGSLSLKRWKKRSAAHKPVPHVTLFPRDSNNILNAHGNIWRRFLLEKCIDFFHPSHDKESVLCSLKMKGRMSRQSNRLLKKGRTSIKQQHVWWPGPWYTVYDHLSPRPLFSSPWNPSLLPLFSALVDSLCFMRKADMSRRNRFAGWLWSCCYDSFICLSHILLSAAVTPQHASN